MSKENFADKLIKAVKEKGNPICVGLDPRLEQIPKFIRDQVFVENPDASPTMLAAMTILEFNKGIIGAVADIVPVVKPQVAFYEIFGADGMWAYQETLKYAKRKGLITIADVKRNDIGSTAEAYARAFLGEVELFAGESEVVMPIFDADSLTINPYLGWDGIKPFISEAAEYGKGMFVLVKTSNASSGDIQDIVMENGSPLFELVGQFVDSWGADCIGESGYSFVGAVVGATYPEQAKKLRRLMPNSIFLVPGYGAQGGAAEDVKPCFNDDGLGAIVNNSRGIIFAYENMEQFNELEYAQAAREACILMKRDLEKVL